MEEFYGAADIGQAYPGRTSETESYTGEVSGRGKPLHGIIIRESSHGYDLIPIQDEMLSHREVELVGEVDAARPNSKASSARK